MRFTHQDPKIYETSSSSREPAGRSEAAGHQRSDSVSKVEGVRPVSMDRCSPGIRIFSQIGISMYPYYYGA